ncbi:glycosyltransferase [soil metagenome]
MLVLTASVYGFALAVLVAIGIQQLWLAAQRTRADGIPLPSEPPLFSGDGMSQVPSVTVQLPLYNEPAVAARLLRAVAAFDYPLDRFDIQVLDDSTDDTTWIIEREIESLSAEGVRIQHIRRGSREGFKAGALAAGLDRARGEMIAIFDSDFVPPTDFLHRSVARLSLNPDLGLLQTRWAHLNAETGTLTRVQEAVLDAHFATEQRGRALAGVWITFNGTAGIWRRKCIEESGGWRADTLAEDLDLAYRAQLAGWKLDFAEELSAPAELPVTTAAWKAQQFRWAKGAAEVARLRLRSVLRSRHTLRTKAAATAHLLSVAAHPATLILVLLHAPFLIFAQTLPSVVTASLAFGLIAFAGFLLSVLLAMRSLHFDWLLRAKMIPVVLAAMVGLSLSNGRAVLEGALGVRTPFVRTPKGSTERADRLVEPAEAALTLYAFVGLVLLIFARAWEGVPFQLLILAGFGFVAFPRLVRNPGGTARA